MHIERIVTWLGFAALSAVPFLYAAGPSKTDEQFMKMAAVDNMTEAHIGQMAQAQASAPGVKDFGQTLSTDHTTAYQKLTELASKTGVEIPKGIGREHSISSLEHLKGASFDHAFLQNEIQAHKTAIAAFKREAEHGEDADVKAYAQATIPTLESHLQTAESLAKEKK